MRLIRIILLLALTGCCQSAFAQLKIVPKEKLDSVAAPPLAPDASIVVFDRVSIDAGVMTESSEPAVYEYGFTNKGRIPVAIARLVTTCSCAAASCPKRVVAPGESSKIILKYDPEGHIGGFTRRVFVYTDDNKLPTAVLKLTVNVIPEQGIK